MKAEAASLFVDIEIRAGRGASSFVVESRFAASGQVVVLFGPSGAGKTLTLRAIAGLLRPSKGCLRFGDQLLFDDAQGVHVPAEARRIGYVPQDQGLFPHLNVLDNVVFGLPRTERKKPGPLVFSLLEELGLSQHKTSSILSLSGGERQRVALCRALVAKPQLLLLDEPFSALDRPSRQALGRSLKDALAARSLSAVLVTHDAEEAASLGDVFVHFERGRGVGTHGREKLGLGGEGGACLVCGRV